MEISITEDGWVLCYGPEFFHLCQVTAGNSLGTGQPHVEKFETLEECYDFARALGWIEPPCSPLPADEWPDGFVPDLDEDGMQLCHDTEPLWVPKPDDEEGIPEFADFVNLVDIDSVNSADAVIDVKAESIDAAIDDE